MTEWLMIAIVGSGAILFPAGGTDLKGKGHKWIRREVLPAVWAMILVLSGIDTLKAVILAVSQDIVFRLPYGDRTPLWLKGIVFCCYPVPSMLLGLTLWQGITPIVIFSIFVLSNRQMTAKDFPWKIVEGFMGFLVGVTLSVLISKG